MSISPAYKPTFFLPVILCILVECIMMTCIGKTMMHVNMQLHWILSYKILFYFMSACSIEQNLAHQFLILHLIGCTVGMT